MITLIISDNPWASVYAIFSFCFFSYNILKFGHPFEAEKFIKKQGLDRVFLECENHMWRIGERPTPEGIIIDGGSDWITLSYKFSKYLIESNDQALNDFKTWFNYTLLPAESFFHTGKILTIFLYIKKQLFEALEVPNKGHWNEKLHSLILPLV